MSTGIAAAMKRERTRPTRGSQLYEGNLWMTGTTAPGCERWTHLRLAAQATFWPRTQRHASSRNKAERAAFIFMGMPWRPRARRLGLQTIKRPRSLLEVKLPQFRGHRTVQKVSAAAGVPGVSESGHRGWHVSVVPAARR
jgi:hypothetical protein